MIDLNLVNLRRHNYLQKKIMLTNETVYSKNYDCQIKNAKLPFMGPKIIVFISKTSFLH